MTRKFYISKICSDILNSERKRITQRLLEIVPENHLFEVGSTAIEGVIGKQDIDFLIRVRPNDFVSIRTALDQIFTRNPDQLSNDLYQGYTVESEMDVAIQLTIEGGPHDHFLTFLSRLRANIDLRQKYNELKTEFDGCAMADYQNAKHKFINEVLAAREDS